jgi:hypothetical protein
MDWLKLANEVLDDSLTKGGRLSFRQVSEPGKGVEYATAYALLSIAESLKYFVEEKEAAFRAEFL